MRQYERHDVDYETWYSPWMKRLAKTHTRAELEFMLLGASAEATKAGYSHLRAIEASASMDGCASRRAALRNVVSAAGDKAIALRGAIEIYDLFPEHTAAGVSGGLAVAPSVVETRGVARSDEPAQVLAHDGSAVGVSGHPSILPNAALTRRP